MKRLLPYFIFAFAFHAILLNTNFSWLKLAPGQTLVSKTLSITLSADPLQTRKAQAAVPDKAPEKQIDPSLNQRPRQNSRPTLPPADRVQKIRQKKNLKALTRKKPTMKPSKAVRPASLDKRQSVPAEPAFIKKTHRVLEDVSKSATTAAVRPTAQIEDTQSGSILVIARPLYKQNRSPAYPGKARRMGYEGTVMLKVLINTNGRVDNLKVHQSSGHAILDRAALAAVKNWLFEPGTEGGIKKEMWVKIPIRFDLE